jgi:hypothetical protein
MVSIWTAVTETMPPEENIATQKTVSGEVGGLVTEARRLTGVSPAKAVISASL